MQGEVSTSNWDERLSLAMVGAYKNDRLPIILPEPDPRCMTTTTRVLIPLDSHDEQTFGLALAYSGRIAKSAGATDVILLTHTKSQLDGTGLSGFLGAQAAKSLTKGGALALPGGGKLRSETIKTLRHLSRTSVIIAYYANEELLDFVDSLRGVAGTVVVPWVPNEADGWAARWNADVHGQEQQQPATLIDDPVVVRALETLTSVINLSTGLGHPRDKQAADEVLRILRAKGHGDPSGAIKSWAIRHKWSPTAASELEKLAKKIWSLRSKPSLSSFHDPNGRYERWKTPS